MGRRVNGMCGVLRCLALCASAAAFAGSGAARAASPAAVTAKINIAIASVTVNTSSVTFGHCTGGYSIGNLLGFPNGRCTAGPVTVTNGNVPGFIDVVGAPAYPVQPGPAWVLCGTGTGAPACTNPGGLPGADQFSEVDGQQQLYDYQQCDLYFGQAPGGNCVDSPPGATRNETLTLTGPRNSTDQSPQFQTQITWTIIP